MDGLRFRHCTILVLVMLVGVGGAIAYAHKNSPTTPTPAPAPSDEPVTVNAHYSFYNPGSNNWQPRGACGNLFASKSYAWRSKYGWTAYGGPTEPMVPQACGMCLNITNVRTGATKIARIMDASGEALELDWCTTFYPLDTDGQGYLNGYEEVSYTFVDCGDDLNDAHPLTSII